jgi:hypothetical protein
MSQLFQSIKDAQLVARKARDSVKATSLSTLIGEITAVGKNEAREITDKDVVKKLTTFTENAHANMIAFGDRRDEENFEKYAVEVELFKSFIPAAPPQMSDEVLSLNVRQLIAKHVAEHGEKPKMGIVMAALKAAHDGTYDPKQASALVKAELDALAEPSK